MKYNQDKLKTTSNPKENKLWNTNKTQFNRRQIVTIIQTHTHEKKYKQTDPQTLKVTQNSVLFLLEKRKKI